jgi:hypothetical protein
LKLLERLVDEFGLVVQVVVTCAFDHEDVLLVGSPGCRRPVQGRAKEGSQPSQVLLPRVLPPRRLRGHNAICLVTCISKKTCDLAFGGLAFYRYQRLKIVLGSPGEQ